MGTLTGNFFAVAHRAQQARSMLFDLPPITGPSLGDASSPSLEPWHDITGSRKARVRLNGQGYIVLVRGGCPEPAPASRDERGEEENIQGWSTAGNVFTCHFSVQTFGQRGRVSGAAASNGPYPRIRRKP